MRTFFLVAFFGWAGVAVFMAWSTPAQDAQHGWCSCDDCTPF